MLAISLRYMCVRVCVCCVTLIWWASIGIFVIRHQRVKDASRLPTDTSNINSNEIPLGESPIDSHTKSSSVLHVINDQPYLSIADRSFGHIWNSLHEWRVRSTRAGVEYIHEKPHSIQNVIKLIKLPSASTFLPALRRTIAILSCEWLMCAQTEYAHTQKHEFANKFVIASSHRARI